MFWKKLRLKSDEYLEIQKQLAMLWLELDVLTVRYKRKVTKKEDIHIPSETQEFDDGFNDLRKLNKDGKS